MAKKAPKGKPGVAAAKGRGQGGTPKKVKTSGAAGSYSGGSGITRETTTKRPGKGKYSKG